MRKLTCCAHQAKRALVDPPSVAPWILRNRTHGSRPSWGSRLKGSGLISAGGSEGLCCSKCRTRCQRAQPVCVGCTLCRVAGAYLPEFLESGKERRDRGSSVGRGSPHASACSHDLACVHSHRLELRYFLRLASPYSQRLASPCSPDPASPYSRLGPVSRHSHLCLPSSHSTTAPSYM